MIEDGVVGERGSPATLSLYKSLKKDMFYCMESLTYEFENLVEEVAIQTGLDLSVEADKAKAEELANWMIGDGFMSITLTHAAINASKSGVPKKLIALIGAIVVAVISYFMCSGCANTSMTLTGDQGGQISYSVDENGNLIITGKPPVVQAMKK